MICLWDEMIGSGICDTALGCVWEISKHPLWIAIVAWLLAGWYQKRSKKKEFRFDTTKQTVTVFRRLSESSFDYLRARRDLGLRVAAGGYPGAEGDAVYQTEVLNKQDALKAAITEGFAFGAAMTLLFRKETQDRWITIVNRFEDAGFEEDLNRSREQQSVAHAELQEFLKEAGRECGFEYVAPSARPRILTEGDGKKIEESLAIASKGLKELNAQVRQLVEGAGRMEGEPR